MIFLIPLAGVGIVAGIAYALQKAMPAAGGEIFDAKVSGKKPGSKPGGTSKLTNPPQGKKPANPPKSWAWLWWVLGLVSLVIAGWLFLRGSKKDNTDVDFYAGALDIPIDEAKKMTREYLAGKYAAKKREEKYGTPDKILGLEPTSIQATYGKKNFEFGGGRSW